MTKEQFEAKAFLLGAPCNCPELSTLPDDSIFIILAFQLWLDGMDWGKEVLDIAEGRNPLYNTREKCIHVLKTVFGYPQ